MKARSTINVDQFHDMLRKKNMLDHKHSPPLMQLTINLFDFCNVISTELPYLERNVPSFSHGCARK